MNGITLMVDEHKYILRMLEVVRKACLSVMKGETILYDDFAQMIDFVRNYADAHHHGKEEKMLFNRMEEEMGPAAEKLVRFGMLVEHDLGRFHMQELEVALQKVKDGDEEARLDVIANAIGYANLLHRHIHKEDHIVYPFAERGLKKETLDQINAECENFERTMEEKGIQTKYVALLEKLEAKYVK